MDFDEKRSVVAAAITLRPELVGGGAPIFHARDQEELERIAAYVSKALQGMVHDLGNGTYIVVKH